MSNLLYSLLTHVVKEMKSVVDMRADWLEASKYLSSRSFKAKICNIIQYSNTTNSGCQAHANLKHTRGSWHLTMELR